MNIEVDVARRSKKGGSSMSASPLASRSRNWWLFHGLALAAIIIGTVLVLRNLETPKLPDDQQPAKTSATSQTDAAKPPDTGTEAEKKATENKSQTIAYSTEGIRGVWWGTMVLLGLFIVVAGHGITGYWLGALIDSRSKMSLSRFQMILWTILIISAYLVSVVINVYRHKAEPTDILIPQMLWLLMGISTTSLIGSPLLKNEKKKDAAGGGSPPDTSRSMDLLARQGVDTNRVDVEGSLVVNLSPDDAGWADLFRGEDVGNAGHLDMGKIQMFYFTLIIVFAYGSALAEMFESMKSGITHFPALSSGTVALLGISHAGYLANKAVTRDAG
jgi:hypothetical protein